MTDDITLNIPPAYRDILQASGEAGFSMGSDMRTCSLLKTMAATKPAGDFLELGTGTGLSTCWILEGMTKSANLTSIDNDVVTLTIARRFLSTDPRLLLIETDGELWIRENASRKFDFIFADTWPGKYNLLNETISMLKPGGIYIVDDMCEQPNWPADHHLKAAAFADNLSAREDIILTRQVWASGIILAVKK